LVAAVVVLLAAARVLPNIQTGLQDRPTVLLVNDTSSAVVVQRCVTTCAQAKQPMTLPAGHSVRIAPGAAVEWLVEDEAGNRLGCVTPSRDSSLSTLYVSRAAACRT
jgi:hypothetical protein